MIYRNYLAPLRLCLVALQILSGVVQAGLIYPYIGQQMRASMKRRWSRQMLHILGIRLSAHASSIQSAGRPGLLVCNHVSFVDIFVINAVEPASFVAKSDVAHWPLIGKLCASTDTMFIERGSRSAAYHTHRRLVDRLEQGHCIAVFPEGTSSRGDEVMPFHSALFQSAIDAGVPIRCLTLSYHQEDGSPSFAPAYVDNISLWQCLKAITRSRGLHAQLSNASDLDTGTGDRRHLAQLAHQAIARELAGRRASHKGS
jgi:1-acyl-sn-glycerol-3-phosphate acyltransferase